MYQREEQQFRRHEYTGLDAKISLPMLDLSLPLGELFDGVVHS